MTMMLFTNLFCRRYAPLVARWTEDRTGLSPAERGRVEAHLSRCSACSEQAESMRRVSAMLRANPPASAAPAPDLWARLREQIEAEGPRTAPASQAAPVPARTVAAVSPATPGRRPSSLWVMPASALAAVILIAAVASYTGQRKEFTPHIHPPQQGALGLGVPFAGGADSGSRETASRLERRPMSHGLAVTTARRKESSEHTRAAMEQARAQARLAAAADGRERDSDVRRREDPFTSLQRPHSAPVLAAAPVVPTVRRGGGGIATVAAVGASSQMRASLAKEREVTGAAAATALEPPAPKVPQDMRVAMNRPIGSARFLNHTAELEEAIPPAAAAASKKLFPSDAASVGSVVDGAVAPSLSVGSAPALSATARPHEDAGATYSLNVTSNSETPAADAVNVQRRQRSLFSYAAGGSATPRGGAATRSGQSPR